MSDATITTIRGSDFAPDCKVVYVADGRSFYVSNETAQGLKLGDELGMGIFQRPATNPVREKLWAQMIESMRQRDAMRARVKAAYRAFLSLRREESDERRYSNAGALDRMAKLSGEVEAGAWAFDAEARAFTVATNLGPLTVRVTLRMQDALRAQRMDDYNAALANAFERAVKEARGAK